MTEVELSAGSILSEDSGGQGPVVVLVPWAADDGLALGWGRGRAGAGRWVGSATLPLGAHRRPMPAEADLSLGGQVRLLAEVLERLGLEEVTLVFNDWCGARLLVAEGWVGRVGRVVLASWATDDSCPPGRPGRVAALAARLPGGLAAVLKPLRVRALRRLPMTLGLLSKRPIPDVLVDQWLEPALTQAAIRRDLRKDAGDTRQGRRQLVKANPRLADFAKPVLVAWAAQDKVMPMAAGRRLAAALPDAGFIELPASRTLIPLDQPRAWLAPSPPWSATTEPMRAVLAGFRRPEDPCGLQGDWPAWAEGLLDDPGEEPAS